MTKKWLTPLLATFLGTLGIIPSLVPTGGYIIGIALAQAAAPNSADDKQLLSNQAARSPAAMLLTDPRAATSFLELAVDEVGNFTCGIPDGAIMLFGHPDPWSSATTIRVDGANYWNYSKDVIGTEVTAPTDIDAVTNESVWDIEGKIKVTEKLQIIQGDSGNADTIKISYTMLNQDTVAHDVGVRVMLDTMLGANDGAPFRVPGVGEVTQEQEFTGADVPVYWEAFERLTDAQGAKARGTLMNDDAMPDRVVFADWTHINDAPWDFVVNSSYLVTDDSSVGVYWNPVAVAAGESITRTTFYGLSGMAVNGNIALSMPGSLTVENGAYTPNPFDITAYVTNNGTLAMTGVTATLTLPAGLTLDSGNLTQTIGNIAVGDSQQISWSVTATGTTTGMLTVSALVRGTNLPAKTVSETIEIPIPPAKATTTDLTSSANPSDQGQAVTFNAAVTTTSGGATPTGDLTFKVNGNAVATNALAAGAASYTASDLTVGAHTVRAEYAGSAGTPGFAPSDAQITQTVRIVEEATTATLTVPASTTVGQPVTLVAKITTASGKVPTGNVSFAIDGNAVGTQTLDATGSASYVANNLVASIHIATVSYAGAAGFLASTAQTSFGVTPLSTCTIPPTALTMVEANITLASATLRGKVTPNNCATTVEFDFGYNNAYGTTLAVSSLAATAPATVVSKSMTGLEKCTEYHYRVVATNAIGSVYGADREFKTTCNDVADAWLYDPGPVVVVGSKFTQHLHVNTQSNTLGGYDFTVTFDNTKMIVDTMFQNAAGTCDDGVCPGSSALSSRNVITDNAAGTIKFVAFDAMGVGPSNDLPVEEIHFIARSIKGIYDIDLDVLDLIDPLGDPIGGQIGRGSHVAISQGLCGDSDGTGVVSIVDALSISRKLVGLPPPPTINVTLADVDLNARLSIGDALHIARHSVGLQVGATNGCSIGTPLSP